MPLEVEPEVFHGLTFNINTEGKRVGFNDATRESLWMMFTRTSLRTSREAGIQGRKEKEKPDAIGF